MTDEGGWFKIPNAVVDTYAARVGATPFTVYAYLVRKANADRQSWPSYTTIQRALGLGRGQVALAIKRLVAHGLITITKGPRAANVYQIVDVTSSDLELVLNRNQSRIETGTSSKSELELVLNRNQIKTQLSRPNYQDLPPTGESGITPSRARTRFAPAHPDLSEEELGEQARRIGTDAETLRTAIIPQWADKRLKRPEPPNGWPADLRTFARSWLERRPVSGNGARASPNGFQTAGEKATAGLMRLAERNGLTGGHEVGRAAIRSVGAPRGHLPRGDPGDE